MANQDPNTLTLSDLITGRKRGGPIPEKGASVPPPPPGYVLQESGPPPPPPGYVLQQGTSDQLPTAVSTPSPEEMAGAQPRSFGQDLGRAAIMTGRNVVQGVAGIPALLHDALVMTPYNAIASAVGSDSRINPGGQQLDSYMNAVGIPNPQPENATERIVSAVDRGVAGGAGFIGAGKTLLGSAQPLLAGLGESMTANAGNQLASAATGAASAQAAHEAGAGPGLQTAALLLGGAAPSAKQLAQVGVQGALRGGEAGRQRVAQNIADFQAAGTMPTVGQATQNARTQGLESLLSKTPGASGQMRGAAERQADQVAQGMESIAGRLSPATDPAKAGRVIERGISGAGGFMDRFKQESGQLYDKLDNFIPLDSRVDVSNTMRVLPQLNELIAGAPATSRLFQNARIRGIEAGLRSDATGAEAAMTRPDVQAKVAQMRATIDAENKQIVARNQAAKQRIDQMNSVRVGQPPVPFQPEPLINQPETSSIVGQVAGSMADGKLPYEAVKKLRTLVGAELENPSIVSDVPRSKWKAVYAALSEDMKAAADQAGPQARSAYNRANVYYNAGSSRIDALARVVAKNGGPEAIFNAATSGTKDGATTLRTVMQSLRPDEQKVLASTIVRRLGKSTPGQQNAEGDLFSMSTFLTNWNKLSPEAKSNLFGRFGKGFADDMDAVARMAANVRGGSKVFANPSGTATAGAGLTAMGTFIGSLLTGHPVAAGAVASGAGTANLTARLMTNPAFVRFLKRRIDSPLPTMAANAANLYELARKNGDDDLRAAADLMQQAPQGINGQAEHDDNRNAQ